MAPKTGRVSAQSIVARGEVGAAAGPSGSPPADVPVLRRTSPSAAPRARGTLVEIESRLAQSPPAVAADARDVLATIDKLDMLPAELADEVLLHLEMPELLAVQALNPSVDTGPVLREREARLLGTGGGSLPSKDFGHSATRRLQAVNSALDRLAIDGFETGRSMQVKSGIPIPDQGAGCLPGPYVIGKLAQLLHPGGLYDSVDLCVVFGLGVIEAVQQTYDRMRGLLNSCDRPADQLPALVPMTFLALHLDRAIAALRAAHRAPGLLGRFRASGSNQEELRAVFEPLETSHPRAVDWLRRIPELFVVDSLTLPDDAAASTWLARFDHPLTAADSHCLYILDAPTPDRHRASPRACEALFAAQRTLAMRMAKVDPRLVTDFVAEDPVRVERHLKWSKKYGLGDDLATAVGCVADTMRIVGGALPDRHVDRASALAAHFLDRAHDSRTIEPLRQLVAWMLKAPERLNWDWRWAIQDLASAARRMPNLADAQSAEVVVDLLLKVAEHAQTGSFARVWARPYSDLEAAVGRHLDFCAPDARPALRQRMAALSARVAAFRRSDGN